MWTSQLWASMSLKLSSMRGWTQMTPIKMLNWSPKLTPVSGANLPLGAKSSVKSCSGGKSRICATATTHSTSHRSIRSSKLSRSRPLFFCPPVAPRFETNRCFALTLLAVVYYFNFSYQCSLLCLVLSATFLRLRGLFSSVLKPLFGFIRHLSLLAALYFFILASFLIV